MSDDTPYSKREIDSIHERLEDKIDLMLTKQDFTNGKVKKLYLGLTGVASFAMGLGIVEAKTIMALL
jgi:hypothetical protein